MYCSTSYLLSKCGMPVCRLAEPAEVKTRCTPAALAASAADVPCRVSACVPPSNGVVIAKREVAPSSAFVSAAVSSSVCELPRLRGVGTARDGANLVTALEQARHHCATLFARASRDDDGKLLTHDPPPFTCDNDTRSDAW